MEQTLRRTLPNRLLQPFSYPFRIFFLSTGLLALLALPAWGLMASGQFHPDLAIPGLFWHQHEMLFGFLSAAIAGFLLTAICVWTGTNRLHGWPLALLWLVWLAGRISFFLGDQIPDTVVFLVNLSFLPLVMIDAGRRVIAAGQTRQTMILVVLGLLWLMQAGYLFSFDPRFTQGGLIMAAALMTIIGGRITPNFSRGWLKQRGENPDQVRQLPALDRATLASMVALLATILLGWTTLTGVMALLAGTLSLARVWFWRGWLVRAEGLLWILHLSMAWIPVGLALLALESFFGGTRSARVHALALGAMSSLILGVMARVCLGHTGRALKLPGGMVPAFCMIQAAALTRVLMALHLIPWHAGLHLSAWLWVLAFAIFLVRYTGILTSPRADGKPG